MKGAQITLDFTIRFEDLTFGNLLGQGAYGKVFAGEWQFNPSPLNNMPLRISARRPK